MTAVHRTFRPGRDRRAVRQPRAGGRAAVDVHRTALVVGGGIAGLAAATVLAERGVAVTLMEAADRLGGRVSAWPLPDGRTMSRGFHAFFRQYYNLRSLLRRVDPALGMLRPVADYPLQLAGGPSDSFARLPTRPPLNLIGFVARSPSFSVRALADVDVRAALELMTPTFPEAFARYDGESAAAFLDRLRFPPAARHLALEVFSRSFFAAPDDFAAGELVAMFHAYFTGSAEGLLFDVPADDYDTCLWAPLGRTLADLGVDVRTSTRVTSLDLGEQIEVGYVDEMNGDAGSARPDGLVLATDARSLRGLVATARHADPGWAGRVAGLTDAPPFAVLRLWLDRPVNADRPAFLGTSRYGLLDNVSVLERFEAGAAAWAARTGGSVVELHAYALDAAAAASPGWVQDRLRAELSRVYPETAETQVSTQEWLLRDDCSYPRADVPWADRPGMRTPDARVLLAGDGIRCELPVALMERAATTGMQAANALLARWGSAGQDVWSVPTRGLLARPERNGRRSAQSGESPRRRSSNRRSA
jgi:carotenoid phi-ring synthase / carotenoid chi-ring synthase